MTTDRPIERRKSAARKAESRRQSEARRRNARLALREALRELEETA